MFVDELSKHETKLDILINNAGAVWAAPMSEFPEMGWDKVMDINVKGLFFMTQKCLPLLKAAGTKETRARVINRLYQWHSKLRYADLFLHSQ